MKPVKDNFSKQATSYAKFRPGYPNELFSFILSFCDLKERAWDVGTGNGQVATVLAQHFKEVHATDISESQLANAIKEQNVFYKISRAEFTSFPDNYFDLITVAQALHWFEFEAFYKEVKRVAKPGAILAAWGYNLNTITVEIDELVRDFYSNTLKGFWDSERTFIDNNYKNIPFIGESQIDCPEFVMECEWTIDDFDGYLNTWSAVQHYIKKQGENPVKDVISKIGKYWPRQEKKKVIFPVFMKMARIN